MSWDFLVVSPTRDYPERCKFFLVKRVWQKLAHGEFSDRYFTRRPLKKPALVVFCLMFAVSPCSAVF